MALLSKAVVSPIVILGFVFVAWIPVLAQDDVFESLFGDSFTGSGDQTADLFESSSAFDRGTTYNDGRGVVNEWQFSKGKRVIKREVWSEENGGTRGVFSIGRGF